MTFVNHKGYIQADKNLKIQTQNEIRNEHATIQAASLNLDSKTSILNTSGNILGDEIVLNAVSDIINETATHSIVENRGGYNFYKKSFLGHSIIQAQKNLKIKSSKGNIKNISIRNSKPRQHNFRRS